MNTSQFVRWSGVAAIVTGIFGIIAALGTGASAPWVYVVSNVATLIALIVVGFGFQVSLILTPRFVRRIQKRNSFYSSEYCEVDKY